MLDKTLNKLVPDDAFPNFWNIKVLGNYLVVKELELIFFDLIFIFWAKNQVFFFCQLIQMLHFSWKVYDHFAEVWHIAGIFIYSHDGFSQNVDFEFRQEVEVSEKVCVSDGCHPDQFAQVGGFSIDGIFFQKKLAQHFWVAKIILSGLFEVHEESIEKTLSTSIFIEKAEEGFEDFMKVKRKFLFLFVIDDYFGHDLDFFVFFTDGIFVHELIITTSAIELGPASIVGEDTESVTFMIGFFKAGLTNVGMRVTGAVVADKD